MALRITSVVYISVFLSVLRPAAVSTGPGYLRPGATADAERRSEQT